MSNNHCSFSTKHTTPNEVKSQNEVVYRLVGCALMSQVNEGQPLEVGSVTQRKILLQGNFY